MTRTQLFRIAKAGKQGAKFLHAIDRASDKVVPFEVSTVPFYELVQIELAQLDATESEVKAFLASFNRLHHLVNKFTSVAGKLKRLDQLRTNTKTHQLTAQQNVTNSILFRHKLKDRTALIDSIGGIKPF